MKAAARRQRHLFIICPCSDPDATCCVVSAKALQQGREGWVGACLFSQQVAGAQVLSKSLQPPRMRTALLACQP